MFIRFQIEYKTYFGQQLLLSGSLPQLGDEIPEKAAAMTLSDISSGTWTFDLELTEEVSFTYRYLVKDDNFDTILDEWGPSRIHKRKEHSTQKVLFLDRWRSVADQDAVLHSSAFLNAILKPGLITPQSPAKKISEEIKPVTVRFKPLLARIKAGHYLAVCGKAPGLGAWDENKSVSLGNSDHPYWCGDIPLSQADFPLEYKYLIRNENNATVFWEQSGNRYLKLPPGDVPDAVVISDEKFEFPRFPWKGAGVAVPVFSLRRNNGFGVGEFTDIKMLVDWAVKTGICLIQVLPVNDTIAKHTWQDSYPYAAISVYALHPVYINLLEIGSLEADISQQIIEVQGAYLNTLDKIDYEAVMVLKARFFKLIYDQMKSEFLEDSDYKAFFIKNEYWLRPYAAFSYLRDLFNTTDFSRWGEYSHPSDELLVQLTSETSPHFDDIAVHYFQQYHAHIQLLDACNYARSNGVVLKGDIPIGIFRNSVDAWVNPQLFHLDCQAGAPPDDFSSKGQNWRFPTYNWEEMAKDNYAWWQDRLKQLSKYFDVFRIDHILGFFRIWEIPSTQTEGLLGYFNPSLPYYRDELMQRGLWMDEERMCKPYIREHFLKDFFGNHADEVKLKYLVEFAPSCFHLHPDYDNQQKTEEKFRVSPDCPAETRNKLNRISQGLNALISEVLFIQAPGTGGQAFFPRNALHFTHSYRELDDHTKHIINELYLDYFYYRNEEYWRSNAMKKLPIIKKATHMLLCGEDLGMVPACVPEVMKELGILSLEVQRMPKDPKITFGHPANYPYLSVATPSSHDTSTIRGWWEEDKIKTQKFYNEVLGNPGQAPDECTPEIVRQIIIQHLYSPSMWAIFPIQDLLGMHEGLRLDDPHAERINNPGNPNHYWRYRMHLSLEELLSGDDFNKNLLDMITASGRNEVY
ncbi:MAG: 4-alpha-glucanotransferase [Bacteroidales bacterium]